MESATEGRDASALLTLKDNAYSAYDAKDFVQSAALFSEVLKIEKTAANYFYAGMSNLEIGNHTIANKNLNTVINNYEDLPENAKIYIKVIEDFLNVPIDIVSNGPGREENIIIKQIF